MASEVRVTRLESCNSSKLSTAIPAHTGIVRRDRRGGKGRASTQEKIEVGMMDYEIL